MSWVGSERVAVGDQEPSHSILTFPQCLGRVGKVAHVGMTSVVGPPPQRALVVGARCAPASPEGEGGARDAVTHPAPGEAKARLAAGKECMPPPPRRLV